MSESLFVIQLALGIVFLLSMAGKLRAPASFARGLADYQVLPTRVAHVFAFVVIPLEGLVAVTHLTGWSLTSGAALASVILLSFVAAVGINLWRGRVVPCFCFDGRGGEAVSRRTLARLFLLLGGEISLLAGRLGANGRILVDGPTNVTEFAVRLTWAAVVLVGAMWLLSAGDLVELVRPCRACGALQQEAR